MYDVYRVLPKLPLAACVLVLLMGSARGDVGLRVGRGQGGGGQKRLFFAVESWGK